MDYRTIRDNVIKPKMIEIFGKTIGNLIFSSAILAAMDGRKTEDERFRVMVETICKEPEVISMWGEAGAKKQMQEWLNMLY
jgi:hypothetical protein